MTSNTYRSMARKRLRVGSAGFVAGLVVGVPLTLLIDGVYFDVFTFTCGLLGGSWALAWAQRRKQVPTADEVSQKRIEEESHPLGLS